jgi:hypothetical protein
MSVGVGEWNAVLYLSALHPISKSHQRHCLSHCGTLQCAVRATHWRHITRARVRVKDRPARSRSNSIWNRSAAVGCLYKTMNTTKQ